MEGIIGSAITAVLALIGVIVTNISSNNKISKEFEKKMEIAQAVSNSKIEELTREVREHNNFAKRMPVVEEQIKVANHRISDLESEVKKK